MATMARETAGALVSMLFPAPCRICAGPSRLELDRCPFVKNASIRSSGPPCGCCDDNQAELTAKRLKRRPRASLGPGLLVRTRERWLAVRGAYEMRRGAQVDNMRVLLIDDVFTTGATLDACARALKRAGAKSAPGLAQKTKTHRTPDASNGVGN